MAIQMKFWPIFENFTMTHYFTHYHVIMVAILENF